MSIRIAFEGWFQCRLSTDPDEFDELRGNSGWTFALPSESNLDRIIRFQDPIDARSRGPVVGVNVNRVEVDGANAPDSALIGAPVHLVDGAVFEGQNGVVASSANEPIVPFHLTISKSNFSLDGTDPIDLASQAEVDRRKPIRFTPNSQTVLQKTGIVDPAAYRQARQSLLENDLVQTVDPQDREGLELRIDELGLGSIRRNSLGFQLDYKFELRGPNSLEDPDDLLGLGVLAGEPWNVEFWMGGWDADALCGFVDGRLNIG